MQGKNKQLQRYNQFKQMMFDSLSQQQKENHPLQEKLLQAMVMIHTLNNHYGLEAVNENDQTVQFDANWAKGNQTVYKLRYKLKNKKGQTDTILFRFIDQNGQLNVNFCLQGDSELQSYTIKPTQTEKQIGEKHVNSLQKILPKKEQFNRNPTNQPLLRPVLLIRPLERDPNRNQPPLNRPENLPFNNPFARQEYVGPNSNIFGNQRNPGFEGPNPMQRYDPVDPFDYKGRIQSPNDFQGFDEFGQPINRPKLPKGPFVPGGRNPFNQQPPPGFGGGFGGGFGQNNFF